MKKPFFYILLLLIALSYKATCQNANLVIQINEKLIKGPLYCSITFDSINGQRSNVLYLPGELLLDSTIWNKIDKDSTKSFWFHFYGTENLKTTPYFVKLTRRHLKMSYLILNVYDFSDKKYKKMYQWLTDKNYLVEPEFSGSGKYIRH